MTEVHPQNRPLGYVRARIYGQTLAAELEQLRAARCSPICRGRVTDAKADRRAALKQVVDAKAQFRSLVEPWADTATCTGRLMIALLGGLADMERDITCTRAAEGRERAKARGQTCGATAEAHAAAEESTATAARGRTHKGLAKSYNVGRATTSRLGA